MFTEQIYKFSKIYLNFMRKNDLDCCCIDVYISDDLLIILETLCIKFQDLIGIYNPFRRDYDMVAFLYHTYCGIRVARSTV